MLPTAEKPWTGAGYGVVLAAITVVSGAEGDARAGEAGHSALAAGTRRPPRGGAQHESDQTADVDSEWIKGWFDVISASEYEVGYYGDPEQ